MAEYHLDDSVVHARWDDALEPRLRIAPGDTVTFECREASDRQITPQSTSEARATLDFDPIHPLTGPVYIEGVAPGDALRVNILELRHKGWGWNAVIPDFGLLADDFPDPYLHHWHLDDAGCHFGQGFDITVPYEPFCGVTGVAQAEPRGTGHHFPARQRGNIDIRGLVAGPPCCYPSARRALSFLPPIVMLPRAMAKLAVRESKHQ